MTENAVAGANTFVISEEQLNVRRVAVVGAGPAGAIATDALMKEQAFDTIRVFERQNMAGGAWVCTPSTKSHIPSLRDVVEQRGPGHPNPSQLSALNTEPMMVPFKFQVVELRRLKKRAFGRQFQTAKEHAAKPRRNAQPQPANPDKELRRIITKGQTLGREIQQSMREIFDGEQPLRKLYDATIRAIRGNQLVEKMESMSIADQMPPLSPDQRIVSECQSLQLKLQYTIIRAHFEHYRLHQHSPSTSGGNGFEAATKFLASCDEFLARTAAVELPRLCVEVYIYYGRIAFLYRYTPLPSGVRPTAPYDGGPDYVTQAKDYLQQEEGLCSCRFQDAPHLRAAAQ
ncbi:hypothetical protein BDV12DRAFT_203222 [Aspergillus spectabilis]